MRLRDLGEKKVAELPEGAVAKRVIFGGLFFALDTGVSHPGTGGGVSVSAPRRGNLGGYAYQAAEAYL